MKKVIWDGTELYLDDETHGKMLKSVPKVPLSDRIHRGDFVFRSEYTQNAINPQQEWHKVKRQNKMAMMRLKAAILDDQGLTDHPHAEAILSYAIGGDETLLPIDIYNRVRYLVQFLREIGLVTGEE